MDILSFIPKIYFPQSVYFGEKSFAFLKTIADKNKLVITSSVFQKNNQKLWEELFGKDVTIFLQDREPHEEDFKRLKKKCQEEKPEYLIALGGGSVLDLAKLMKKETGVEVIAIPTTIGSGAEVSQHALLITNMKTGKKISSSQDLLPNIVIINPLAVKSLPKELIIFQSIDALSHALESLVSRAANSFSESLSLMAIDGIYSILSEFPTEEEISLDVLGELQINALLAGLAQSSAATGLNHAFAHYFGAKNNISHSKAVTLFFLETLELNHKHTGRYQKLDKLKNLSEVNFIEKLKHLFEKLKIKEEKIQTEESLDGIAEIIKQDICCLSNPHSPQKNDILEILKKKTNGTNSS